MIDRSEAEAFLAREARLLDEERYSDWLDLWLPDGDVLYWVPLNGRDPDPRLTPSLVYDDRARLEERIERVANRWPLAQEPGTRFCRMTSSVEVEAGADEAETLVHSAFHVTELRRDEFIPWIGHAEHRLVETGGTLKMRTKKVVLINNAGVLPTMTFVL